MMSYNLFSDPHLFTNRAAHTTRDSARLLQSNLYSAALKASEPHNSLCLGDLFDKPANPELALVQGHEVAKRCRLVMAGNHDETNRTGVVTTLDALHSVLDDRIVIAPNLHEPHFTTLDEVFWIVPHHASQAVFEQAMQAAMEDAENFPGRKYLLLHCNYDSPFDLEDNTLNLTPDDAQVLLETFSRIFIGHEHNHRYDHNNRVVVVGNTHPTSFSDISNKYRWELEPDTDRLTHVQLWAKADHYRELRYGEPIPELTGVQFVDVTGAEPVANGVEVADYVRSVWDAGESLIAVRNHVEIMDHLAGSEGDMSAPALVDLKQRIMTDLEDSDLQALYRRLLVAAEAE